MVDYIEHILLKQNKSTCKKNSSLTEKHKPNKNNCLHVLMEYGPLCAFILKLKCELC